MNKLHEMADICEKNMFRQYGTYDIEDYDDSAKRIANYFIPYKMLKRSRCTNGRFIVT